jgi:hypothetical protein
MRHKTTASKIIKSQNKIVRTVEFTLLPHPLEALKPSFETFELLKPSKLEVDTTLDARESREYAREQFGSPTAKSSRIKGFLPRLANPPSYSRGRKILPRAPSREPKSLAPHFQARASERVAGVGLALPGTSA